MHWNPRWAISFLLLATLACTLPGLKQPQTTLIFAPDVSAAPTADSLKSAQNTIQNRLKAVEIEATVSVENSTIKVELYDSGAAQQAIELVSQRGEVVIFEADSSLAVGDPVPPGAVAILNGSDLTNAEAVKTSTGQIAIQMEFTPEGAKKIAEFSSSHIGKVLAIAVDGKVILAPTIRTAITGNVAMIEGRFDLQTTKRLATVMHYGPLPFSLTLASQK